MTDDSHKELRMMIVVLCVLVGFPLTYWLFELVVKIHYILKFW